MTTKTIITRLTYYNEWRRGAEVPQPGAYEVGKTIDEAIKKLKQYEAQRLPSKD